MKRTRHIDELIAAVLSGQADEKEKLLFKEWLNTSPENQVQFEHLQKVWQERSSEPRFIHSEELAEKIWQKGVREEKGTIDIARNTKAGNRVAYLLKIAAVVAIFVSAPYLIYLYKGTPAEKTVDQDVYAMISKNNPAGQKARINLPDGSVVWLNSSSSLNYPAYFSDSARTIELIGEAYFEVKKDSLRPFTVKSGNIFTTALGTSFNINAYPDKNNIHIGLITGKVWIRDAESSNSIILNPNHGAVYSKEDKMIKEVSIDPDQVLAWKNGILRFDGENFPGFIDKLEKWYGVNIIVEGEPPYDWHIRGEFADEYLTNILTSVSFNKQFSYSINRKEVVLKFK